MKIRLIKTIISSALFACAWVSFAGVAMTSINSAVAQAPVGRATCGVETLHGSYLFATLGWNIIGGVAQPKAIVEGIDFNGDGTLVSPFATVSINGNIIHSTGSPGTYTMQPDCTGTVTFTGGATFDIFVEANGKQLWMIQTGPAPAVFEGTATRVSR